MFEAIPILEKEDTEFSDGNLASLYSTRDKSVDFYMQIPFNKVYHDKSLFGIDEIERYEINRNRSAEVLIPKCLDLTYLRKMCCRSQAEYETLITLLPKSSYKKWKRLISVSNDRSLFFSRWNYINKATTTLDSISFIFNSGLNAGPFKANLEIIEKNKY